MFATLRLYRSTLIRAAFTALLVVAFAFLAAVIVGGAVPSLDAAAPAFGLAVAFVVAIHWIHLPPCSPEATTRNAKKVASDAVRLSGWRVLDAVE